MSETAKYTPLAVDDTDDESPKLPRYRPSRRSICIASLLIVIAFFAGYQLRTWSGSKLQPEPSNTDSPEKQETEMSGKLNVA